MVTKGRSLFRICAVVVAVLWASAIPIAQTPAANGKSFIWKVDRDGRVGWLVGSLHLLTPEDHPLPASMLAAFARADTLMEEADVDEMADPAFAAALMSKALYPPGQSLESQLSRETYRMVLDRMARAGLPLDAFRRMKPWMIGLTLVSMEMARAGFDPALGVDQYFKDEARKTGKRFRALETAREQVEFLDALSAGSQESLLRETLESADTQIAQVRRIANAWRAGDAVALRALLVDGMKDAPEAYQSLIVERNRRWLPRIESCFATASCYVVVGAAHLVGDDGLIDMLRQKGYRLDQQ